MTANNSALKKCTRGLGCSWTDFDWAKYPRGVRVSFALVRSNQLMLVKPARWNYAILGQDLVSTQTLGDAMVKMHAELDRMGIRISMEGQPASSVVGTTEIKGVFHVLVLVPVTLNGSGDDVEFVSQTLILSGYRVSCDVAMYIPELLGWPDPHYMFGLENQPLAA